MNSSQEMLIGANSISSCRLQDLEPGTIARIARASGTSDAVVVLSDRGFGNDDDDEETLLLTLEGEHSMKVWASSEWDPYAAASDLGSWTIEVDPASISEWTGLPDDVGKAYLRGSELGFVTWSAFTSRPLIVPFSVDGRRASLESRKGVALFSRWRIVYGPANSPNVRLVHFSHAI